MNLMSIKNAIEMVEKFKKIYPNDYKDIKLSNGGKFFKNYNKHDEYYTLEDLENNLKSYMDEKDIEYKALKINNCIILNEFELLGICELNLHCPERIINI